MDLGNVKASHLTNRLFLQALLQPNNKKIKIFWYLFNKFDVVEKNVVLYNFRISHPKFFNYFQCWPLNVRYGATVVSSKSDRYLAIVIVTSYAIWYDKLSKFSVDRLW